MAQRQLFFEPSELSRSFEAPKTEKQVSGPETSALLNA